ncbi:polysaccharide export protein [Aliiglaciecola sp.]|nr:polysaccharide export protein [Aliiglaciecola sp.]
MKQFYSISIAILMSISSVAHAQNTDKYRLSTDDVISITVFNEPELGLKKATITDSGTISVPLVGQVSIKGKTVPEVEALLTKKFGDDYLKKPSVSVSIDEYRPFYINGEVKKPGSYPYRSNMTVQIAITIAGGFTERASKHSI